MSTALAKVPGKRQIYDCVIIGGQLGGNLAAALLAKRGHRVLVLDHDGLGEGYADAGYSLPYAPTLLPPLKAMPAAEAAFGELGMLTDLGRLVGPHDPELQVLLPGHRFDLARDPAQRGRELAREFADPKAAEAVWAELAKGPDLSEPLLKDATAPFPPRGFWQRWQLKRRAGALPDLGRALEARPPEGHPLAAVARGLADFLTHLHQEPVAGLALSRALGLLARGPQKLPLGREGLRGMLHKRIRELGGDVQGGERPHIVEELELSGRRVAGTRLVGGDAVYVGRAVVSATDAAGLRRLLPPQARKKHLAEQLDAVRLRRFLLTVNLVLPEEHLPLGLAPLGVLAPRDEELGLLVYEVTPAVRAGAKEKDKPPAERVVCVGALVPAQARDLGDAHLEGLAHRVRDAMLEVLPLAQPRLVSVPMLTKTSARGSRLSSHPLFEIDEPALLGVTGLSIDTPLKNLFLASREVLPGLGLEGEIITGVKVAERVQGLLKKSNPLAEE